MRMSDNGAHTAPAARTVRCPRCGKANLYAPSNPYRPFCSQRCQQGDLGDWAAERYRIAAPLPEEDDGGELAAPPPLQRH